MKNYLLLIGGLLFFSCQLINKNKSSEILFAEVHFLEEIINHDDQYFIRFSLSLNDTFNIEKVALIKELDTLEIPLLYEKYDKERIYLKFTLPLIKKTLFDYFTANHKELSKAYKILLSNNLNRTLLLQKADSFNIKYFLNFKEVETLDSSLMNKIISKLPLQGKRHSTSEANRLESCQ